MKRLFLVAGCWLLVACSFGQTVTQNLQKAFQQFEADPQLKHAISSLYVIDAATGKVVFDKNSQIGLAPASTQKIITAATAFELLGKDYRYKTTFSYSGEITKDSLLLGEIYLEGNGDPTLGSWRFSNTGLEVIKKEFINELHKRKIYLHRGSITGIIKQYDNKIPDGWIWQDLANYYGASSSALNWNENQFDLILKPGKKINDSVKIVGTRPFLNNNFISELKSGEKQSGDNAYLYFDPSSSLYYVRGTVPCCVDSFKISGAVGSGDLYTVSQIAETLYENKFKEDRGSFHLNILEKYLDDPVSIYTHYSPTLDSIIYWFLQKSINLYGEALIKTFAYEKNGFGSTESGVKIVKDFWKQKGIDEDELNIGDGSGLSPQNRVTTHAQVEILKYAKKQSWFPYFYQALPEYNGMKMKSGTIKDVKGFCGYHKARNGKEYIFSFLVNNYNGPTSGLVGKMYSVLNVLK